MRFFFLVVLLAGEMVSRAQFATVSEMVSATVPAGTSGQQVEVSGRSTANDGGGGIFVYSSASTTATNLGTVFKPAASTGRWLRLYNGPLNVLWFGALSNAGDATTTTAAIQNAIDTAAGLVVTNSAVNSGVPIVRMPSGEYLLNSTLWIGKSNLMDVTYWLEGEGRNSTKLLWKGTTNLPMVEIYHPAPGQLNIHSLVLKHFYLGNPYTTPDNRVKGVEGIRLIGNINPADGNVAGVNKALFHDLGLEGLENGIHVYNSTDEMVVSECEIGTIAHLTTTESASKTDALTDRGGNCILIDGDWQAGTGTVGISAQVWMHNNTFIAYQSHAVDLVRVSQMTFQNSAIVANAWTRSSGVRVRNGSGVYISGNFTQCDSGANYGPMFDLGSVGLGPSEVGGFSVVGNQIQASNSGAAGAGVKFTVAAGVTILGNSFNHSGKAVDLAATVTNVFLGMNDYVAVTTKLTDAGAVNLHVLDNVIGNQLPGNLTMITAGSGLRIKEGSNARMGTAVLNGGSPGTVTVANTSVTANTRILLTVNVPGGTVGAPHVSARTVSTSFTITSSANGDTSTVGWLLVEPSP